VLDAEQPPAEANGEDQHPHTEDLGEEKVSELVDEHQDADQRHSGDDAGDAAGESQERGDGADRNQEFSVLPGERSSGG